MLYSIAAFWGKRRNLKSNALLEASPLSVSRRFNRNIRDLLILTGLHVLLFLGLFSRLDLPLHDDANYFGHGILFGKFGSPLYGDLYPIPAYFAALLYRCMPLSNTAIYAVYAFFSQWIFLVGSYAFIQIFSRNTGWSFLATLLLAVVVSYPFNLNVQLFPAGMLLCLLGWMESKKSLDIWLILASVGFSYLLRPEYSLITAGFSLPALYRQSKNQSHMRLLIPDLSSLALVLLFASAAWPVISWGTWTNRFETEFENQFAQFVEQKIAEQKGLSDFSGISPAAPVSETINKFFPPEHRRSAFLARWCPVLYTASAYPRLFLDFLTHQATPFLRGDFSFSESQALSSFLSLFVLISLFVLAGMIFHQRQWDKLLYLYFSAVFVIGTLPVLCGSPTRHHLLPAIVWLIGVIPSLWLTATSQARWFVTGLITVAVFNQFPHWKGEFQKRQGNRNWQRVEFLVSAEREESMANASLAEAFPIFSVAFCRKVGTSSDYHAAWDEFGHLRSNGGTGAEIQYVLFEKFPPGLPGPSSEALLPILRRHGTLVAEQDPFALWKVDPVRVFVTDDLIQEKDLCLGTDIDLPNKRQLVIRWNLPGPAFIDFHIWVKVDGGKEQYLGRTTTGQANRFVWEDRSGIDETGAIQKESEPELAAAFLSGPELNHQYEFVLYGIPESVSPDQPHASKPQPFYTKGPLEYREAQ